MAPVSLKVAVVLTLLHASTGALADPGTGSGPAPPVTAPTTPATPAAPDGTTGENSTIAPHGPDASPEKVEEAKEVAKTAALTPIIPNPGDSTRPAFLLYAEIDLPILAVGGVFAMGRRTKTQPAFCAPACDSVSLNALDKVTAGYYSAGWSKFSDVLLYGLGAGAGLVLLLEEGFLNAVNDGVVIGEATLSATAVASIMTLAAGRPRPFLYGDPDNPDGYKAPLEIRNSGNAALSFLSSHTAEAFAIATSLYIAERRLHPRSLRSKLILGTGLTIASLCGVARIMAGYHFITDVVGGALVGSSLGFLVASVHGSPVKIVPVVNESPAGRSAGLGIQGSF